MLIDRHAIIKRNQVILESRDEDFEMCPKEFLIDANSHLSQYSIEQARLSLLEKGFDPERPIVVDEEGLILDGNHRFIAALELEMSNEIEFVVIPEDDWREILEEQMNKGSVGKFGLDDEYFYETIQEKIENRNQEGKEMGAESLKELRGRLVESLEFYEDKLANLEHTLERSGNRNPEMAGYYYGKISALENTIDEIQSMLGE